MMLDEQITKLADCLQTIYSSLDEIKSQSETRNKAVLAITAKMTNALHILENEEDLSDEKAAEIAKAIAENRRKRREHKRYIEISDPLILFMQENGEAMDKLRLAVEASKKMIQSADAPVYNPRVTNDAEPYQPDFVTQNGVAQFGSNYKPPRPILCQTAGGLKIAFSSIGQAARAFLYSSGEIVDCAKGNTDSVDGDRFSFIDKDIHDPAVRSYSQARNALINELKIRSEKKKFEARKEELVKAAQERKESADAGRKSQIGKFQERWAAAQTVHKTEPEPEPTKRGGRNRKSVRGIADDGTTIEYPSIRDAESALGKSNGSVRNAIRDGYKCGGYRWEYIKEEQ